MFSSNATPAEVFRKAARMGAILNLDDLSHVAFVHRTLGRLPELMCARLNPGRAKEGNAIIGRPEEAKEYLTRNVDLYPDSYSARVMYVQFLSYTGELETMAEECEKAFEQFPFEPAFLEYKIMAYYNMQDYQGAIREGERMLSLYPNDPERQLSAYSTLGDMYYRVGDLKRCFDVYDKALKIDPDYALVLNNYAYFMCLTGKNLSKAYKMSKKAVELEPDNSSYLDTIGWILHLRGKDAEAKTYFKKAMIYGGKDSQECLSHYAQVLEKLGETELSKYYYDLARKLEETE